VRSCCVTDAGSSPASPFQLAADIIETSIAPSWEDLGQLGAIAVIRTFLNFFLERDLAELGGPHSPAPGREPAPDVIRGPG
jgi:hypothetical protein